MDDPKDVPTFKDFPYLFMISVLQISWTDMLCSEAQQQYLAQAASVYKQDFKT